MGRTFAFAAAAAAVIAGTSAALAASLACDAETLRRELAQQAAACQRGTLNFVIGYNPGGNTYTLGNGFIAYLRRVAGDDAFNVSIEAKPGASGEIASRYVADLDARDAACQILVAQSNQLTTNQIGVPNPIDPMKDLVPISFLGEAPLVLTINPAATPLRSAEEWARAQRTASGDRRHDFYGSNGNYATDHLATERLMRAIDARGTHVPFTGSAPMILSLVSASQQQIDFGLLSLGLITGYLSDGRLVGLAVAQQDEVRIPRKGQDDIVIPSIDRARFPRDHLGCACRRATDARRARKRARARERVLRARQGIAGGLRQRDDVLARREPAGPDRAHEIRDRGSEPDLRDVEVVAVAAASRLLN